MTVSLGLWNKSFAVQLFNFVNHSWSQPEFFYLVQLYLLKFIYFLKEKKTKLHIFKIQEKRRSEKFRVDEYSNGWGHMNRV